MTIGVAPVRIRRSTQSVNLRAHFVVRCERTLRYVDFNQLLSELRRWISFSQTQVLNFVIFSRQRVHLHRTRIGIDHHGRHGVMSSSGLLLWDTLGNGLVELNACLFKADCSMCGCSGPPRDKCATSPVYFISSLKAVATRSGNANSRKCLRQSERTLNG